MLAYLRLCRLPTVFTALADIVMGYLLTHPRIDDWPEFAALLGASAGLYLSGMVFNDLFDIEQDTRERPGRPIPSGAVTPTNAFRFASGLMLAGLVCATLAGRNSLAVALALACMVLGYDRILKRTPLGPLAMGSCRFLNVLLGASAAGERLASVWQLPQIWVAIAMGTYITGVTWFARKEAGTSSRAGLIGALVLIDAGLAMLALWISGTMQQAGLLIGPGGVRDPNQVLLALGVTAFLINRRCFRAIFDPVPQKVQPAIGVMLLSIIVIDATIIYFKLGPVGTAYSLATVALLIPAVLLRRWIPLT